MAIAARMFQSARQCDIRQGRQRVYYGHIRDSEGRMLDEVLVHVMRAPHSYTRENVVEINCHSGAGPLQAVLEETLRQGARLAAPGEFTRRAFLNGRIDLVQAEAVIDLIRARTRTGLQAAQAAAGGVLSRELYAFRETLADALARVEAAVDFPEEDLPELVDAVLLNRLSNAHSRMRALLATAEAGRLYREGAAVAVAGRPNVGKSSVFNALLRDARAIVSVHAGTTRDRIEEYITVSGVPVRLIDTAGLRPTDDEVERLGIEIARNAVRSANIVLLIVDASVPLSEDDHRLAQELAEQEIPTVLVMNKIDLAPSAEYPAWDMALAARVQISALTGDGLSALEETLSRLLLGGLNIAADSAMITRTHQKDSLSRAAACVGRLLEHPDLSPEFLAMELRDALQAIGEITGETTPEDLLDIIFSSFCIGK